MFIKKIVLGVALSFCLLFPITDAMAIVLSNNSSNFSYSNPGARANAMGGAFIAVADDATAAYTNPAGLSILTKPEIALEFKSNTFTHRSYDYSMSKNSSDYKSTTNGFSFLSFTYPLEKVNVTLYRHELLASDNSFEKVYSVPGFYQRFNVTDKNHIVTYGLSGSYKVLPTLSLGFSVGFDEFNSSHSSLTTAISGAGYIDDISWSETSQAQHFSLAFLWNPFSTFNIGMVYRYGPSFEYNTTLIRVTTNPAPPGPGTYTYAFRDKLKMPDLYGVGISYRFPFGLTAALDYNYVLTSQTFQDNVFPTGSKTGGLQSADEYKRDDTYEIRAGVEYVFAVKETPLAIRGGYSYRPSNGVYYSSNKVSGANLTLFQNNMGMWDNKEQHNFSLGFGAVLGKNFQIDISGTWGTFTQEYITSLVYRF